MPDRVELSAGVAVEDVLDLSGATIDDQFRHACGDVVAWWVEREATVEIVADAFASQREIDPRREQRVLVTGRW